MAGEHLELFAPTIAPVARPRAAGSTQSPGGRSGAAAGVLAVSAVPVPARCPATGGRTCYRDGCYDYHPEAGGLCSHPDAAGKRRRRRSRRTR